MTGPARLQKPSFSARLVIEASQELRWTQKAVWLRIDALNTSARGCYASAESLGDMLGIGGRAVEKIRGELVDLGLVVSDGRAGRNGSAWFAVVPASASLYEKPTREQHVAAREALDGWIRMTREDGAPPPSIPNHRSGFPTSNGTPETPNHRSGLSHENTEPSFGISAESESVNTEPPFAQIPNHRSLKGPEIPNHRSLEIGTTEYRGVKNRAPAVPSGDEIASPCSSGERSLNGNHRAREPATARREGGAVFNGRGKQPSSIRDIVPRISFG